MLSMLGNDKGEGPGGFLLLNNKFEVTGPWEANRDGMKFNYDFWYQPRHNVMVSSEWGAPNTVKRGFKLDDVDSPRIDQQLANYTGVKLLAVLENAEDCLAF